ncbi:MAG: 4-alpha-glucanotransferase [Elusimicrobiaceae bacterium]|nr:4-alpha-glucanotransferase [Elusimicrobiaceae bacterium]
MHLHFTLPYRTRWGEQIKAVLRLSGFGMPGRERVLPLHTTDGETWKATIEITLPEGAELIYYYAVYENGSVKRREWRAVPRKVVTGKHPAKRYELRDAWRDAPALSALYSTAYTNTQDEHLYYKGADVVFNKTIILRAFAPQLKEGEVLCLCGEEEALGAWNTLNAVTMQKTSLHEWSVSLDAEKIKSGSLYKFVVRKTDGSVEWEQGADRVLPFLVIKDEEAIVLSDQCPLFGRAPWRAAGVVLPVFSIRTEKSFGVGDFGDLKTLADWAAISGQKVIQLLPINDTTLTGTWTDSYPYNAVSVYALHPMYVDLNQLPALKDKKQAEQFEQERKKLNALPQVDYEEVNKLKRAYLQAAFKEDEGKTFTTRGYQEFFDKNRRWLVPYAAFSYLRDQFGTPDFSKWPRFSVYNRDQIFALCAPTSAAFKEISFHYYVQYTLHKQLLAAADYARSKGILLKGDIPIGVSRQSADAWAEPKLYNLNAQAGAPPDPFSATGQNWGFPTYNWSEMAKDGYSWWLRRFEKMAEYFDAYRVDHILGFFRIWEIPLHSVQGLLGQFAPALGFTKEEIKRFFGLEWKDAYLTPYISEEMLQAVFGEYAAEVKEAYLTAQENGYALLPEYDTQRKVEAYLGNKKDEKTHKICEGLYTLINQVLFVPDHNQEGKFHPRIAVLGDWVFNALSREDQAAFSRLYNHYFYERHNDFWAEQAAAKLPAVTQSTRMLPCAEDLGMIPACVPAVLDNLKMLTLEIQRMPKQVGVTFASPRQYPWMSVCCIATHDMSPLRLWWTEDRALTQQFYNDVLGRGGEAPKEAPADVCEQVVRQHLESPSLLCLLGFQDWTSMDEDLRNPDFEGERINVPANPRHYWRYRMHVTVEDLIKNDAFNTRLRDMIEKSGR